MGRLTLRDDIIHMTSELLERMLMGQETLDDFLMLSKGVHWMVMMTKAAQGTLERPRKGKTGLESPRKKTCAPSALEACPSHSRSARPGQTAHYTLGMHPICSTNAQAYA